jgi:hypothetical protein
MAKGKHATALFEVMNKSRLSGGRMPSGASEGGFPTPKWWFKSRGGGEVKVMPPDEPSAPAPVVEVAPPPVVEEPPAPRQGLRLTPLTSSVDIPEISPPAPSARLQPVVVSVDPDRQQINLRLSYTSALIGGFGFFIALGLAVLIGKGLSRGPSPAIANTSTQQLRKGPVTPGVLNVQKRGGNNGAGDPGEDPTLRATTASTGTRVQPSFNDPRPPATFFADDAHRSTGLNYAIIQTYPEKAPADKAAEFFTKNGVPCTVEKDLPGYRVGWKEAYMLVGIRGFAKTSSNAPLEAYKKSIVDVSSKYTNGRSKFSPLMYLWRKSN